MIFIVLLAVVLLQHYFVQKRFPWVWRLFSIGVQWLVSKFASLDGYHGYVVLLILLVPVLLITWLLVSLFVGVLGLFA